METRLREIDDGMVNISRNMVSVVIPTYNRAKLLERSLNSLFNQTKLPIEVIVIDDDSTDNTSSLIEDINSPLIKYIKNSKNYGANISRNIGINESSGDIIAFLDSDDEWVPEKIEIQTRYIQNHSKNSRWICYTPVNVYGRSDDITIPERGLQSDEHLSEYLFIHGGIILTSTLFVSREAANLEQFTPDLKLHQDADYCLKHYSKNTEILYLPEPLTNWHNDYREDRIYPYHKPMDRLNWLISVVDLFTPRAIQSYIENSIIPKFNDLEEKDQSRTFIAKLLTSGKISLKNAKQILYSLQ